MSGLGHGYGYGYDDPSTGQASRVTPLNPFGLTGGSGRQQTSGARSGSDPLARADEMLAKYGGGSSTAVSSRGGRPGTSRGSHPTNERSRAREGWEGPMATASGVARPVASTRGVVVSFDESDDADEDASVEIDHGSVSASSMRLDSDASIEFDASLGGFGAVVDPVAVEGVPSAASRRNRGQMLSASRGAEVLSLDLDVGAERKEYRPGMMRAGGAGRPGTARGGMPSASPDTSVDFSAGSVSVSMSGMDSTDVSLDISHDLPLSAGPPAPNRTSRPKSAKGRQPSPTATQPSVHRTQAASQSHSRPRTAASARPPPLPTSEMSAFSVGGASESDALGDSIEVEHEEEATLRLNALGGGAEPVDERVVDDAEDATAALHRALAGNDPLASLKSSPRSGQERSAVDPGAVATAQLHRSIRSPPASQASLGKPPLSPRSPRDEAEDATEALHRALSANDPRSTASTRSARHAAADEAEDATEALHRALSTRPARHAAADEAEDATEALHRALSINDPVASLRGASSPARASVRASASPRLSRPDSPPATRGMLGAASRDASARGDGDDDSILEASIVEDPFRRDGSHPLDESTNVASDTEEPWAGAFAGSRMDPGEHERSPGTSRRITPAGREDDSSADEILTEGHPTPRRRVSDDVSEVLTDGRSTPARYSEDDFESASVVAGDTPRGETRSPASGARARGSVSWKDRPAATSSRDVSEDDVAYRSFQPRDATWQPLKTRAVRGGAAREVAVQVGSMNDAGAQVVWDEEANALLEGARAMRGGIDPSPAAAGALGRLLRLWQASHAPGAASAVQPLGQPPTNWMFAGGGAYPLERERRPTGQAPSAEGVAAAAVALAGVTPARSNPGLHGMPASVGARPFSSAAPQPPPLKIPGAGAPCADWDAYLAGAGRYPGVALADLADHERSADEVDREGATQPGVDLGRYGEWEPPARLRAALAGAPPVPVHVAWAASMQQRSVDGLLRSQVTALRLRLRTAVRRTEAGRARSGTKMGGGAPRPSSATAA